MNKKTLFCCLLFLLGCTTTIDLYPAKHFVDLSKNDLVKESTANYNASGVDDYVPSKKERDAYFISLVNSSAYRNYLVTECVLLLHKEHHLDLKGAVFASYPKWSSMRGWYSTIFNFQVSANGSSKENTMECDLIVNDRKEVREYQLINYAAKFIKD
ncbi:MAG: hypothetical protein ACXVLQ_19175 [Bacteriovorax sp.]